MSKVKRLISSYSRYISVPWRPDAAAAQRVVFVVYDEQEELRLRCKIDEFDLATRQANHNWALYDLTDTFPAWMSQQRYAKSYFDKPNLLTNVSGKYLDFIYKDFTEFLSRNNVDDNTVVALQGVGSLFGFLRVKDVVDKVAPEVRGRLLVFFPGSYEGNNYRLLDGYDGWNYLAVPITADKEF